MDVEYVMRQRGLYGQVARQHIIWRTAIGLPSTGKEILDDKMQHNGYAYIILPTPIAVAAQTGHYDPNTEWPSDMVFLRLRTSLRLSKQDMFANVPPLIRADTWDVFHRAINPRGRGLEPEGTSNGLPNPLSSARHITWISPYLNKGTHQLFQDGRINLPKEGVYSTLRCMPLWFVTNTRRRGASKLQVSI